MNEQSVARSREASRKKTEWSPARAPQNESFQSWRFGKASRMPSFASEKTCSNRLLDVHQDLRDGEKPNGHPDETDAVKEVHAAEAVNRATPLMASIPMQATRSPTTALMYAPFRGLSPQC